MDKQRLIDTDELQKKFRIECAGECAVCKYNNNFESCELIDSAPIVDAVPVVRCKDCKYAEFVFDSIGLIKKGLIFCEHLGCIKRIDFYCADGERNDGDSDG